jgi:hypothetical protein
MVYYYYYYYCSYTYRAVQLMRGGVKSMYRKNPLMSGPCQDISTAKALLEKKLVRQALADCLNGSAAHAGEW